MNHISIKKHFDLAVIILFLLILFAPPLKALLSSDKAWSETEKRKLASFPEISSSLDKLIGFPKKFEAYYNDHFGFRDYLIKRYHREMKKRFGITGTMKVITGKEGWYYFAEDYLLDDFRGMTPLKKNEIEKFRFKQHKKEKWLADQGIRYLYFIVPNKQTVYPEYLPDYFIKAKGKTRLVQLEEYLKQNYNEPVFNLYPYLYNAKKNFRLYDKTDTHWNDYGAYIAYKEIIKRISHWFPGEQFKTDYAFHESMRQGHAGDLTRMSCLSDSMNEMRPVLKNNKFCAESMDLDLKLDNFKPPSKVHLFMKGCKKSNLRAVVFRDSFFSALEPFFSENFKEIIYLLKGYDQEDMNQLLTYFHPDIVIEEKIERARFRRW